MQPIFIDEHALSLDDFASQCAQQTAIADYPLAERVEKNVVIYQAARLLQAATQDKPQMLSELHQLLASGPGVFVVQGLYRDKAVIDRNSALFETLLKEESATHSGADHFATAGSNGRIWNALQKVAERDADAFIDYYANPLLALICEAWLGPGYQMTAQVNQVRPGGKAQQPHRDYHLGFQQNEVVKRFPLPLQILSQYLTLQGAVAHSDMPLASGPTQLLPWSQHYQAGYLAWRDPRFIEHFQKHYVQLPLSKGDGLFFNPALFHAAGTNSTQDHIRTANLLQISSSFGKAMEQVNRQKVLEHIYPSLRLRVMAAAEQEAVIAAAAEGYSFPTNLDTDPPAGGLAPQTQQQLLRLALKEKWSPAVFNQRLQECTDKRRA